jgi:3-hydroxyisobutyrate dehydrogenase
MSARPAVGFTGLGAMGAPMARHLAARGLLVAVANRTHARAEALAAELGVAAVEDPVELARRCEVIVTCVTADADVLALCEAYASAGRAGLVVVDTSTIASASARRAAQRLRAAGGDFVDAPVSGGVEGAKNGRLSVMAGGDATTLERARPVLDAFAARVTHMGDVGAGQDTKAVNQVLVAGIAQAVTEGLALGQALGLDPERLLPTLQAGAANSWFLEKRGATMLRDEFAVGFKLSLLHKDLRIVQGLARDAGTDTTVIDRALADYARLISMGHGDDDISGLIRLKRPPRC